jgi:cell fate (sporulation/competence/biofilm development) regulator YlbF (YheA/YmcA/DUF963 family)
MDQVIVAARSLGKAIQEDERYIRYRIATQKNDEDTALQERIAEFQELRNTLSAEMTKEEKDHDLVEELNKKMRGMYGDIFGNENMRELTEARNEMETLLGYVNQIINGSSNGQDPELIDYQASCGGSCASCAGCS